MFKVTIKKYELSIIILARKKGMIGLQIALTSRHVHRIKNNIVSGFWQLKFKIFS